LLGTGFAISYNKIKERMENGVKNLKGARLFPKTYASAMSYNEYGDASQPGHAE
jgi:hypothetical protein